MLRDALSVAPGAEHEHRRERVEEEHPDEVEAGHRRRHAALLLRVAVVVERHRKAEPGVVAPEPRAPHDVLDLEHAAVREHGLAALDADGPLEDPLDAGVRQVAGPDPDERPAVVPDLAAGLAADRGRVRDDRVNTSRTSGASVRTSRPSSLTGSSPVSLPESVVENPAWASS